MAPPKEPKGPWTAEEVARLTEAVNKYGEGDWDAVRKNAALDRSIKACRDRWINHVKPDLIKDKFTEAEKGKMIRLNHIMGNKWTEIATKFPGRSADDVETCCNLLKSEMNQPWITQARLASRTQQLVDDSQAAHNPDTTGKTSVFGQGSWPFHHIPDPFMDGKSSSMFAQRLVSSQFPADPVSKFAQGFGSSWFSDPDNKFGKGLGWSQFPDLESTIAQGSGSSQFPPVFPSPVMQQHNNLDSTFSSTPAAAGPELIDLYTGLSGNTSMNTGLYSILTGSPRNNDYLQSMYFTARSSDGISEEELDKAMNPLSEVVEPCTKKQKIDK